MDSGTARVETGITYTLLNFKSRLLSSGRRSEVWGEVSGLWRERRSWRDQACCGSYADRAQHTTMLTPGCKHGTKTHLTHYKPPATWDCWESKARLRPLEERRVSRYSQSSASVCAKLTFHSGLGWAGVCFLNRVELPWF